MSLFSLIFNSPTKAAFELVRHMGGAQGTDVTTRLTSGEFIGKSVIEFDASLSETHERASDVSQNAIEDGSNIADNVNLKPKKLSLKGFISDAPVTLVGSAVGFGISSAGQLASQAVGGGVFGNLAGTVAGLGLGSIAGLVTGSPRKPKDVWKSLEEVWELREPFAVVTALQRYDNMVISRLSAPRSASVGKGLEFDVTLEQVKIVSSSIIKVAAFKTSAVGAQSQAKLGKQAGKEVATENNSILFNLSKNFRKG